MFVHVILSILPRRLRWAPQTLRTPYELLLPPKGFVASLDVKLWKRQIFRRRPNWVQSAESSLCRMPGPGRRRESGVTNLWIQHLGTWIRHPLRRFWESGTRIFRVVCLWEVGGLQLETSSRCCGSKKTITGLNLPICVEKLGGTVSSNSRFQTVLVQQ